MTEHGTELYEFTAGGVVYRYTSASQDQEKDGEAFTAQPLGRDGHEAGDDLTRSGLTVRAMRDLPYVTAALASYQMGTLQIFSWDGDADTWLTLWDGRVVGIALEEAEAVISTESVLSVGAKIGLYGKWQTLCRHRLYSTDCGADPEDFDYAGTVSVVSGATVTIPGCDGQADGYYTYGYAVFDSTAHALIIGHAGDVLTLFRPVPGLAAGAAAVVYAGCDRSFATCKDRFDNALAFGGFPWLPVQQMKGSIAPLSRPSRR